MDPEALPALGPPFSPEDPGLVWSAEDPGSGTAVCATRRGRGVVLTVTFAAGGCGARVDAVLSPADAAALGRWLARR